MTSITKAIASIDHAAQPTHIHHRNVIARTASGNKPHMHVEAVGQHHPTIFDYAYGVLDTWTVQQFGSVSLVHKHLVVILHRNQCLVCACARCTALHTSRSEKRTDDTSLWFTVPSGVLVYSLRSEFTGTSRLPPCGSNKPSKMCTLSSGQVAPT